MESHQLLATMAVQRRIDDLAASALPNAPVLPVRQRRRPIRRLLAVAQAIGRPARPRPTARSSAAARAAQCGPSTP
jgi:hypothetical protein